MIRWGFGIGVSSFPVGSISFYLAVREGGRAGERGSDGR